MFIRYSLILAVLLFFLNLLVEADNTDNEQEKKQETEPYPVLKRLRLIEFKETLLPCPFKVKKLPNGYVIQSTWLDEKGKHILKYVGDSIRVDRISYTIVKIIPKYKELRRDGTIVRIDESKAILKSEDGKYTFTIQMGKDVYSPKPKAVIKDLLTNEKYHVGTGEIIKVYVHPEPRFSQKTGKPLKRKTIKYKVINVDRQKNQITVEYQDKKSVICINNKII